MMLNTNIKKLAKIQFIKRVYTKTQVRYDKSMRLIAGFFIGLFFLFSFRVYAADRIISPVPDDPVIPMFSYVETAPSMAFGDILSSRLRVLGATTEILPVITEATPVASLVTPTPTITTRKSKKPSMTITVIGDSMVDTLGPEVGGLASKLRTTYPATNFTIINHGVGAENIDSGLVRLTNGYTYLGAARPSVISQKPDVIIIESFGYNPYPFDEGALTKHWLQLSYMVDTVKQQLPETKIMIAATIAPNWNVFGDGAPFINFSAEGKKQKVDTIKSYIDNAVKFAKGQKLPLADAFHTTMDSTGNGKLGYINGGDHIHYSDSGRSYMASILSAALVSNKLLE